MSLLARYECHRCGSYDLRGMPQRLQSLSSRCRCDDDKPNPLKGDS